MIKRAAIISALSIFCSGLCFSQEAQDGSTLGSCVKGQTQTMLPQIDVKGPEYSLYLQRICYLDQATHPAINSAGPELCKVLYDAVKRCKNIKGDKLRDRWTTINTLLSDYNFSKCANKFVILKNAMTHKNQKLATLLVQGINFCENEKTGVCKIDTNRIDADKKNNKPENDEGDKEPGND